MRCLLTATLLLTAFAAAQAQTCTTLAPDANDGVIVAPKSHRVIYEDQDVRVIDVVSLPHTTEEMHTHIRPSIFIVLEDHPYLIHFPKGKPFQPPVGKTPYVIGMEANPMHAIENAGDDTLHAVRVELKHPGCGSAPAPLGPQDALVAAPAEHVLALENDDVRILSVTVPPHTKEPMHTHAWSSIAYFDQPTEMRYITPDSPSPQPQESPSGLLRLDPEGPHSIENTSGKPLHLFRIELKHALPTRASASL